MSESTLYIVATPIGNLSDITQRALEVLKSVDVVLCEDTRVTEKLLSHFEIKIKKISLHQHTSDEKILSLLNQFNKIAYVSDAGTPGISDPGNKLVSLAVQQGINIIPIPGASAVTAALSVSGFPTDKFLFLGFMPRKGQGRTLETIKNCPYVVCFYESPHRIVKTLQTLFDTFGDDREVMVGRELTKMFETIYRGKLRDVITQVREKEKGEFVIVINYK